MLHGCQAVGLVHQNLLEDIPHPPGVAEGDGIGVLLFDEVPYQPRRLCLQRIAALFTLHLEDPHHLIGGVVGEVEKAVEPGLQTGVGVDEPVHEIVIPRRDDHQIVPVVLHGLEDGVDGLPAEVVLRSAVEGVGLVDEQHAPQGGVDNLPGL